MGKHTEKKTVIHKARERGLKQTDPYLLPFGRTQPFQHIDPGLVVTRRMRK
jgi:hypothetical protein